MTVGGATRECGGGALPPDPVLGEGVCQNVLKEVSVCVCVCVCVCAPFMLYMSTSSKVF